MPFAKELKEHARSLLGHRQAGVPEEVELRRAVSAAYYAVFHLLCAAVAEQMSPPEPSGLRGRTQRALEHSAMANAAVHFSKPGECRGVPADIGIKEPVSTKLANIANAFLDLQEARNRADYDVLDAEGVVSVAWASECVEKAERIFEDWNNEKESQNAKVFLAALMLSSKWNKKSDSKR